MIDTISNCSHQVIEQPVMLLPLLLAPLPPPLLLLLLQELAALLKDPSEAARVLAANGDYLAAAERCMAAPNFFERLTPGQLRQVHTWLLRVGTVAAARKAVQLWETVQQHGRLGEEIGEGIAAAQLMLGRLLLREAAGAALQPFDLKQAGAAATAAAAAKAKAEEEKKAPQNESKREKKKREREEAKQRQKQGQAGAAAEEAQQGEEAAARAADAAVPSAAAAVSITTEGRSYAAAAGAAVDAATPATPAAAAASSTTSAAQAAAAAATAALKSKAAMPTACLAKLPQLLQEQPQLQVLVTEAVRHLADAQAAFANCQQQAGVLEALSWSLAARPAAELSIAQYQVAQQQGGEADVVKVVKQVQEATQLLQALASVTPKEKGSGESAASRRSVVAEHVFVEQPALCRSCWLQQVVLFLARSSTNGVSSQV
jgi:hypothetical protein